MDEADSPRRIEIGHNPDAESSVWARPPGDAEQPDGSSDGVLAEAQSEGNVPSSAAQAGLLPIAPPSPSSIARRRVVAAAAGIAVLALLVWWAIGRAPVASVDGEQGAVTGQAAPTFSTAVVSTPPEVGAAAPGQDHG